MTVTKISAFYSRRVAPDGDFTHREANATIEVSAEDLDSADIQTNLDEAMNEAHDIVHRYIGVGGGKSTGSNSKASGSTKSSTQPPTTSKGNISENPEDRTDPGADDEPKETAAEAKKRKTAETRAKNKAKKEAEAEAAAAAAAAAAEAESDDDGDFNFDGEDDATEAPDEITDDDLQKAANAVVVRLQQEGLEGKAAPKEVSKIIAGFKPDDHEGKFGISMLKQKARRKFIEMIEAQKGPDADD